jgi:hypothetical protein
MDVKFFIPLPLEPYSEPPEEELDYEADGEVYHDYD